MRADNSRHIVDAARRRSEYTRSKAIQALRSLDAAGDPINFESVANKAGVSRSWLYTQPDLRVEIQRLRATDRQSVILPSQQRASDASLRRRLEASHSKVRQLTEENRRLREQLAMMIGNLRAMNVERGSLR